MYSKTIAFVVSGKKLQLAVPCCLNDELFFRKFNVPEVLQELILTPATGSWVAVEGFQSALKAASMGMITTVIPKISLGIITESLQKQLECFVGFLETLESCFE